MAYSKPVLNGTPAKAPAVDPSALPTSQAAELVLQPANPTEYTQASRLNADEWRGPLTLEQYMGREKHLLDQDLTRDNRSTGWILTSPKLPLNADGTRPILASCETIVVNAYVARDGKLSRVLTHGIGSVFTRPEHRGKGYAGRMMIELGKRLETWQQHNGDKSSFSVLYSDIGQKFYTRFGWKVFPSTHIHLMPVNSRDYQTARQGFPYVEDLSTAQLRELPAVDYVEQDLKSVSVQHPGVPVVAIVPDLDHFAWHHAREEFVSEALGRAVPTIKGAIHRATGVALVWVRVYAEKQKDWQLHVLHAIIPPAMQNSIEGLNALSALLLRAQREADEWEMLGGVEVWSPSEYIVAAGQNLRTEKNDKVEVITRDFEHLSSLRWIGPGDSQNVIWRFNEKFAWC